MTLDAKAIMEMVGGMKFCPKDIEHFIKPPVKEKPMGTYITPQQWIQSANTTVSFPIQSVWTNGAAYPSYVGGVPYTPNPYMSPGVAITYSTGGVVASSAKESEFEWLRRRVSEITDLAPRKC